MSKEEIIEAFENLRYFESTDEIEWGRVLSEADRAIEALKEQLILYGVGSSTFKVAISDNHCTYNFELELPKTTCIRDISQRLYGSFGLKEKWGTFESEK
tara:strand:+ start:1339 stop:1638 length:300 start_codon:yes stop_codon:yes gene_type:complete